MSLFVGRIKRQLELAGERASDAEIESMLDSKSTQIFYRFFVSFTLLVTESMRLNHIKTLEANIYDADMICNLFFKAFLFV